MDTNLAVTLGLGVGTILASGITSSIVTYRLNRNKDQFDFMRTKAEALYLAADEFGKNLGSHLIPYYSVIKGEMDWNQMLDLTNEWGKRESKHGGFEVVTMLVDIYFPSVRPTLASLLEERDKFGQFTTALKMTYKRDQGTLDPTKWIPILNKHATSINSAIDHLEQAIVAAARSYAGVRQQ